MIANVDVSQIGHYFLSLAWVATLAGVFSGLYAGKKNSFSFYLITQRLSIAATACTAMSIFILAYLFLTDDYSNQYVWQHSNKDMPWIYKITAIWGGMDGSMLLWAFFLSVSSGLVAWFASDYPQKLMPWVLAVSNSSLLFFLTIVFLLTNPFRFINADFIPPDGNGLNPLLQNPYMAIHPPMLYLGFTTFAIPFAFCIGALLANRVSNEWIQLCRRWSLIAWALLTTGIVLGGHWAYIELGWGGFWAWDPVENASFLPWLTGTAFIHSVMVQERKQMLKTWNVWLIVLTYGLTIFGTFLTRSGIVQSVHAFASTNVGWVFLTYLGIIITFTIVLTRLRKEELRSSKKIESFFSREAAFLLNNLIFLSIAFATLWGVMFPVFSEAVTGTKQAVGIPFFNTINVPLFLALIFLMAVGPLIAWRKANLNNLKKTFLTPFILSFLIASILVWAGITKFYPVLSYSLCCFVLFSVVGEIRRGLKAQKIKDQKNPTLVSKSSKLFKRHKARYSAYLVHIGIALMCFSITASSAHKVEKEFSLSVGQTYSIGRFNLRLEDLRTTTNGNYSALIANVSLNKQKNNKEIATLKPELRRYIRNKETTTEVALRMGAREDVYLVLAGTDDLGERATFKLYINPLQVWLWIGTLVVLFGTCGILYSRRYKIRN